MTEVADSLNQNAPITTYNFFERVQDTSTTEFAFWISVSLLIVCSILKYVVSHNDTLRDWGHLFIEIPVDLCLVVLTILVTIYLRCNIGGGIGCIILTILALVICCITRRKSMIYSEQTNMFWKSFIMGATTVIISLALSTFVYNVII